MIFHAEEFCKNAVVNAIRGMFSLTTDEIAPYKWHEDLKQTKISIFRANPTKVAIYPAVIVTSAVGEAPVYTYFNDHITEGDDTVTVGGKFQIDITVQVIAQSTVDKERTLNILLKGLIYVSKTAFNDYGLVLENPIRIGGETQETYGGITPYYSQTLDMTFYTEWEEDVGDFTELSRIDVETTFSTQE